jgi:hypothetical protein
MYRHVAGLTVAGQLPHNVSFMRMIEAILDDEEEKRRSDVTGTCDTAMATQLDFKPRQFAIAYSRQSLATGPPAWLEHRRP